MSENWKPLWGYEDRYLISDLGNVRSINYKRLGFAQNLKWNVGTNGYITANLCKGGKQKTTAVHRLVALHFIPNPHNYTDVNHKDEDKTNPAAYNLEWGTHKYNGNYGTCPERIRRALSKSILQMDMELNILNVWASAKEAHHILKNVNACNISECCKGRYKQHNGFIWRFV